MHLGQDVAHAAHHQHVADAGAGLDAGAGAGRHHHHPARAVLADDPVRDGVALEGHSRLALHASLGVLGGLLDRRRHLVGLAVAVRHPALAVADDDQGVEAEAASALHDGGTAADLDHSILNVAVAPLAVAVSLSI